MSADPKTTDYFVAGGTLRPHAPSYVKRPADDQLFNLVQAGTFCYILTARQMGKSSLMTRTERHLKEAGVSTATIDLTSIGTVSIDAWYLGLLTELTRQLGLATDPEKWWQEGAALGQPQRFTNFLRDIVLTEIKGQVVIFIDEIDSTLNLDFADDFFAAIRFTYNARAADAAYARLTFVLLGVATPSDLIKDASRTPFNVGQAIDLHEFTWDDAQHLQQGLISLYPEQGEAILQRIFYWTNGHPYLTQKLCSTVVKTRDGLWSEARLDELVGKLFLSEEARNEDNLKFVQRNVEGIKGGQRRRLLGLYRRVYAEKKVKENQQSLDQNRLKLFALVGAKNGILQVRNEIYRRAFNLNWIKTNTPIDWNRWISVAAMVIALVLGVYIWQQSQQTNETLAQAYITNFNNTTNPTLRLDNLANLFGLEGYDDEARALFDPLSLEDKIALFANATPDLQPQVRTVVKETYTHLNNTEEDNRVLQAMQTALEQSDEADSKILTIEIGHWLDGRATLAKGIYEEAKQAYDEAIKLNETNSATHFERAIVLTNLADYPEALTDFEAALTLDEGRREEVQREVMSDHQLYDAWWNNRREYPALTAVVPTPTNTPTPTETPIPPTSIPTSLPITFTPTWTPMPTNTPVPLTLTPSPSIPTNTPPLPTPTQILAAIGRIAFASTRDGQNTYEIYVMNADGSNQTRLTNDPADDYFPAWSPDGQRIAFTSERDSDQEIYVMNADGSEQTNLTNNSAGDAHPTWSPDGTRIAFTSIRDGNEEIYIMNADGSGQINLTNNPANDRKPTWSPDGSRIAFASDRNGQQIFVMDADGNNQTLLTGFKGETLGWPTWSPDGQHIAFTSNETGNVAIHLVNPDGNERTLTSDKTLTTFPTWSPDSRRIAFLSNRDPDHDDNSEIYVMNIDGSGEAQLTYSLGADSWPAWSPR